MPTKAQLQKKLVEQEEELHRLRNMEGFYTEMEAEVAKAEQALDDYKEKALLADNLREQMILDRFTELFAKKDYLILEAMLENYDLF